MTKHHVLVKCDVYCDWKDQAPVYRLYVGNELFTERTYIWKEQYLEEMISVYAQPGCYEIRYELLPQADAELTVKNIRIEHGPESARIMKKNLLRIYTNETV